MELTDKVALVTGGGTGIGRAICLRLAQLGARVMVSDVNESAAKETAALLYEVTGRRHGYTMLDVTSKASAERGVQETGWRFGRLDILCNNAGVSTMNRVEDLTETEWDLNFNVNIKGMFFTTQAAIGALKETKGKIINTASMASLKAAPLLAHYTATKYAVLGFTKACALEFSEYGVTVNCVCPGYVKTSMQEREVEWEAALRHISPERVLDDYIRATPLGRLCMPEDVAKVVCFLASSDADYLTGEAISVTGGGASK